MDTLLVAKCAHMSQRSLPADHIHDPALIVHRQLDVKRL